MQDGRCGFFPVSGLEDVLNVVRGRPLSRRSLAVFIRRLFFVFLVVGLGCLSEAEDSGPLVNAEGITWCMTNGRPATIHRNPAAHDPWLAELIRFIKADGTNRLRYVEGSFVCTEFAVRLHDNAERAGLRAAIVFVTFASGPGHALTAFRTRDHGLVFVDCTGGTAQNQMANPSAFATFGYLERGKPYGRLPLDVGAEGPNSYSYYQKIMEARQGIDAWAQWLAGQRSAIEADGREIDQVRAQTDGSSPEQVARLNALIDRYNEQQRIFNERIELVNRFSAAVEESYALTPTPVTSIDIQW